MTPSPADALKDRLARRTRKTLIQAGAQIGRLSDTDKKTPSQKITQTIETHLPRS